MNVHVRSLDLLALSVVAALGLLQLKTDVGGDQYLYLIGAQKIAHHGVMYRDFWDLKQPGIYYLYALGGTMFSFTPTGMHGFDALYQTVFALVMITFCRKRVRFRWVASLAPMFAIGAYEGLATNYALGSVEGFVGLPLFIAGAAATSACGGGRGTVPKALAAGLAGALVISLKFAFLPIVLALWVAAFWWCRNSNRVEVARIAGLCIVSLVITLACGAAYFSAHGALANAVHTMLVDPPAIIAHLKPSLRTPLLAYTKSFVAELWPLGVFAFAALTIPGRRIDPLVAQMAVWIAVGALVIAVQVWSFNSKFFVIVVPIGVLAAYGCGELWLWAQQRGIRARAACGVVVTVLCLLFAQQVVRAQRTNAAWSVRDRLHLAAGIAYFSGRTARPGSLYVFGDPKVYFKAQRDQPVAINGWSPELLLPSEWRELASELRIANPRYIFVENSAADPNMELIDAQPDIGSFLVRHYRVARTTPDAIVYVRRN